MWNLIDALALIQEIQGNLWNIRWHVTLAGGVLNHGSSAKDLDLVFLPFDDGSGVSSVLPYLTALWGTPMSLSEREDNYPPSATFSGKMKFFLPGGRRIDVFICKGGLA